MKQYRSEIGFGLALLSIFVGLLIWAVTTEFQTWFQIGIALVIILTGVSAFVWKILKKKRDIKMGLPAEDEFTNLVKIAARSQSFEYSLYLWLLIFVFNASFDKNQTMLGVGILGSAVIYYVLLWYYRMTGETNAYKD